MSKLPIQPKTSSPTWLRDSRFRVLLDIGLTDANPETLSQFDPENIVRIMRGASIQELCFYVQCVTGWLYYPSAIGRQHPCLKGRDAVGELVEACHRQGLRFTGYYAPNEMGIEYTAHPEWRTEWMNDPVPTSPRLWGNLCFNRPGCWSHVLGILRESVARYAMDAAFIDNFWRRDCGCPDCRRRGSWISARARTFRGKSRRMTASTLHSLQSRLGSPLPSNGGCRMQTNKQAGRIPAEESSMFVDNRALSATYYPSAIIDRCYSRIS